VNEKEKIKIPKKLKNLETSVFHCDEPSLIAARSMSVKNRERKVIVISPCVSGHFYQADRLV